MKEANLDMLAQLIWTQFHQGLIPYLLSEWNNSSLFKANLKSRQDGLT